MNFDLEDAGPTKRRLNVEVPAEKAQADLDQALKLAQKQARLKGFRPGKVPKQMIKRMFGDQVEQEVAKNLIQETLPEAMEKVESKPVSPPVLEESHFKEGDPFRYTVSFDVKPEFEITGYKGLPLSRETVNVTEEMVDKKIEDLRQAHAATRSLEEDRPLEAGDLALIDYQAYIGDKPLEGATNPNYQLEVGSGSFNPDFEARLEGMNKGQSKEITVTFPEDHYNPKIAGHEVRFEVKLNDIKEKIYPELTSEFVKDLGRDIETLEELRELIRKELTAAENQRVESQLRDQLTGKLRDLVDFEVPEGLLGQEIEAMVSNTQFNLKRSGLSLEAMGMSEAKLREDYRPEALTRVKNALILERIAEENGLEVSDEDLEDRIGQIARETGQPPESIRQIYSNNNIMDSLREACLTEKTLNYLLESANIVDVSSVETDEPGQASEDQS